MEATGAKQLGATWRSILSSHASPLGARIRATIARRAKAKQCPLCLAPMEARHLKTHQRGDWCRIAAIALRAKLLGLKSVPLAHERALLRAGLPYGAAPVNKTVSGSGNALTMGLFTVPEVAKLIARTKAGSQRDAALRGFAETKLKAALAKLPAPARQRSWVKAWNCPSCETGRVLQDRLGAPLAPELCQHLGAARYLSTGALWVRPDLKCLLPQALLAFSEAAWPTLQLVQTAAHAVAVRQKGAPVWLTDARWDPEAKTWLPQERQVVLQDSKFKGWELHGTPRARQPVARKARASELQPVEPGQALGALATDPAAKLLSWSPACRAEALRSPGPPPQYLLGAAAVLMRLDPAAATRKIAAEVWASASSERTRAQVDAALAAASTVAGEARLLEALELLTTALGIQAGLGAASVLAAFHPGTIGRDLALFHLMRSNQGLGPQLAVALRRRLDRPATCHRRVIEQLAPAPKLEAEALDQLELEGAIAWAKLPGHWHDLVALSTAPRAGRVRLEVLRAGLGIRLSPVFLERVAADVPTIEEALRWQQQYPHARFLDFSRPAVIEELGRRAAGLTSEQVATIIKAALLAKREAAPLVWQLVPRLSGGDWWNALEVLVTDPEVLAERLDIDQVMREVEATSEGASTELLRYQQERGLRMLDRVFAGNAAVRAALQRARGRTP